MEVIVVLGLLGTIAAIGAYMSMGAIGRVALRGERDALVFLLHSARAAAVSNVHEMPHGVYVNPDEFVLYAGDVFVPLSPSNRPVPRNTAVEIAGLNDIRFENVSGRVVSGQGDVTFSYGGQTFEVEINDEGRIEW